MRILKKMGLFALIFGFASVSLAADSISVTVVVDKSVKQQRHVYAVGFSVNNKGKGGLGYSTTKTGPTGGNYSFGFKSLGKNVSCGSAVLKGNSTVVLYLNKSNQCSNKVFPKKKS